MCLITILKLYLVYINRHVPGSDYAWSLKLLQEFKRRFPGIPTKSGLMLGLGERTEEVEATMADLRAHDVDMITLGQYLAPSPTPFTCRFVM